jgi:excisionase family DNA binding protein
VWLCIHESDKRTVSRRNQIGFLRVALAANAAKKQYRVFTEANVTPEMIAPEIQIYASSQSLGGTAIANVQTIVVLPHNSKDSNRAVHPTRMNEASEEYKNYKNLFGFGGEGKGMLAVFPLDVRTENNELHVVNDTGIPSSNGAGSLGGCTDCKVRLYPEKVRRFNDGIVVEGQEVSLDSFTQAIMREVRAAIRDELNRNLTKQETLNSQPSPRIGPEPSRQAVSIREAARLLSISPRTVDKYVALKVIPVIRIGRRVLIPMKSVNEILSRGISRRRV